ncbi:hypothetical protein ACHWQZ_G004495 [Mnemiopsis leidyi]
MGEDESVYRQIVHPLAQQTLKSECGKLTDFTKTIQDFLNSLSSIYDTAGSSITKLVEENKKKISEVTRENLQYPNTTLTAWLGLLENFKEEGALHSKFAGDIKNETVVTLQEQRNHVKESIKRIYGFRDGISSTAVRESEHRDKCQKDYSGLWSKYKVQLNSGTTKKGSIMPTYTAYNNYLLQLTYSNGINQSALDVQLPNLMQELEAVEHNLHNFLVSVLSYTFSRQDHHFNECRDIVSNSSQTIQRIDPALDVAKLGESLVLPPDIHPIYLEKEFIPADTEDSGIPKDVSNGYLAKEEYTAHTLCKKYKRTKKELSNLEVEVTKRNKDLDALSKLLATYQENPTYGKASDIEVQMSNLRNELRLLEMSRCGFSSQLGLLEESGVAGSGSLPSDEDDSKSINSIIEQGEHEWIQLSMTEMKSCDHCQKPTMLQRVYQCNKCKVNVHNSCRNKVFDCVGQPLVEQTADKVSKIKDTIIKGAGGIFSRGANTAKKAGQAPDPGPNDGRDMTLGNEWWTLKHGSQPPNLAEFAGDEDVYDNIDEIKKESSLPSEESDDQEPDDTYLNMTDFKTRTDKQTKLPTKTDNDSESETTLTRSVTPHTFGAVLDSSFTIENSIFEEGEGQESYEDMGKGSYVDMGKGSYVDMGKGSYVDMGKGSYVDMGKGSYVDMGKGSYVDMGKGSYIDTGSQPPPLPNRTGRATLRQVSGSPPVPSKPTLRPATPPKPPPKPSREDEMRAPMVIRQSEQTNRRPPLAPPKPPVLTRPDFPPEEASLLTLHPMAPGSLHVCVALYEYKDLEHSSEAWCAPGFRVDVLEMTNEDWHKGICNGQTGYFPSNYLEKIPERGAVLRCLYDYQALRPDELSISAGQVIFRLEDQNNGWIYGRFRNNRGLFPASYVEELEDFR